MGKFRHSCSLCAYMGYLLGLLRIGWKGLERLGSSIRFTYVTDHLVMMWDKVEMFLKNCWPHKGWIYQGRRDTRSKKIFFFKDLINMALSFFFHLKNLCISNKEIVFFFSHTNRWTPSKENVIDTVRREKK